MLENLLVDTKPIVIEEQKSTTPVKKKTPMVILDDTPEPVKKVKTPKKPTPKKEVTPKTATPKKDLLEKVEDSKAAATSSSVASPSVTEADVPKKKFK